MSFPTPIRIQEPFNTCAERFELQGFPVELATLPKGPGVKSQGLKSGLCIGNSLSANCDRSSIHVLQSTVLSEIGMTGFEPAAPSSRTKCATKLRYIPLS